MPASPTNSRARKRRTIGFVVGAEGLAVQRAALGGAARRRCGGAREGRLDPAQAGRAARARTRGSRRRASSGRTARRSPSSASRSSSCSIRATASRRRARARRRRPSAARRCRAARLHVGLPRDAGAEQIRDAVQSWLKRQARRIFTERSDHFAPRLGVRVTQLSLSTAATRWGSASADGAIRLNWRLVHFRCGDRLRGGARAEPPARDGPQPALLERSCARGARLRGGATRAARSEPLAAAPALERSPQAVAKRIDAVGAELALSWPGTTAHAGAPPTRPSRRSSGAGRACAEQHRQQVGRAAAPRAQASSTSAKRSSWCACSWSMRVCRPRERLAVRGQHQRVGRQRAHALDRVEEQRQRVGLGLEVVHADVGGDARQHHVAADQHAELVAVQRDVLRRMAVAGDAAPGARRRCAMRRRRPSGAGSGAAPPAPCCG